MHHPHMKDEINMRETSNLNFFVETRTIKYKAFILPRPKFLNPSKTKLIPIKKFQLNINNPIALVFSLNKIKHVKFTY